MDWFEQLDNYCERLGPAFWAEPVNALTNIAFAAAAFLAYRLWRQRAVGDHLALALIAITLATGVGSFLFHSAATRWALLTDVIPIVLFIHLYLFAARNRFLGLDWRWAAGMVAVFFLAAPAIGGLFAPWIGSSAGYMPALLALFVVGALVRGVAGASALGARLMGVGLLFALSLTFRTLDEPLCAQFPLGTHFFWHLLNGAVLYLLLATLIDHRAGRARSAAIAS